MVASMNEGACVFPMANPVPEIHPDEALAAGAAVVGSGRSDYKNQINNVLAFPGIFRGALDCRAKDINEAMKMCIRDRICPRDTANMISAIRSSGAVRMENSIAQQAIAMKNGRAL